MNNGHDLTFTNEMPPSPSPNIASHKPSNFALNYIVGCFMILDCGIPTSVNHSTVLYSHGTLVGANATYTCSNGYKVSGQQTIICQSTGKWANEPYCFIGWYYMYTLRMF